MKEHSFFLALGFTLKNANLTQEALGLNSVFNSLLIENIALSNGIVGADLLNAGEAFTEYTPEAEKATEFYTGVPIDMALTHEETNIAPGCHCQCIVDPNLEQAVASLNERILCALRTLIGFKEQLLSDVLSCRVFTLNYPLLIDHLLREAKFYHDMLERFQQRIEVDAVQEAIRQQIFWNRIMAEHAKVVRGLLDPTENDLIRMADNFGRRFDRLRYRAIELNDSVSYITRKDLDAARDIRNFKAQGTAGLLNCQIRSIIVPLLADHILREANHYVRLLKIFRHEI